MKKLGSAILQLLPLAVVGAITWLVYDYFDAETSRLVVFASLATVLLWPIKYRKTDEGTIRIPYLFVGFCELAIIVFDRFKPIK